MEFVPGGVTAALGFEASGVSAGIKGARKPDLALIYSETLATAAGVFTTNRVQAAPVILSKERLRYGKAQAVLLNSGNANCLTGARGRRDAETMSRALSRQIEVDPRYILLASTGMIGRYLPIAKIERAIPILTRTLGRDHHRQAARAILTTDTYPKEVALHHVIHGKPCHVGGMAKGAGMIAPSMATMLCVITTDADLSPGLLRVLLRETVERTFNRISVDGDMSTNDTVFALASGRSGMVVRPGDRSARMFTGMLEAVGEKLAGLIVKDGEGATRTAEISVAGARTEQDARACARAVASSPLVKTMLAGGDPNVGRIAAAVGASPARFDAQKLEVWIGGERVIARGVARRLGNVMARQVFSRPTVLMRVHLHAGRSEGRMLTCDLTEEYVRINARYST